MLKMVENWQNPLIFVLLLSFAFEAEVLKEKKAETVTPTKGSTLQL